MTAAHNHLGFKLTRSAIRGRVLIPKYYNPELADRLAALGHTHELVVLGDLVRQRQVHAATGDEIGKMAYGTGTIPFVRTSDISNWEIKTDPKQGVSTELYEQYATKQDVRAGDLFFVRDGTYLIGASCMVTEADARILYQSHILKFRVLPEAPISAPLLLALLSAPATRRQIRAKQFTADIIDTLGNRYQELILPLPRDLQAREEIEDSVRSVVEGRVALRERLRRIPLWVESGVTDFPAALPPAEAEQFETAGNLGFATRHSAIRSNIFVPRYYDPKLDRDLAALTRTHDLIPIGDLVEDGVLAFSTGIEVGKMAYDTGEVPFVRTSDISNWELKADPKQNVSEELYEETRTKLDVRAGDIFVVRDGTYLVGTSCILTEHDTKVLYAGGIYKIRVKRPETLDPYLLLALLNTPIVRRQMRAKQFTRDVIDTLGRRIFEVVLPIPKDVVKRKAIAEVTRETVETRVALRNRAKQIALQVEGVESLEQVEEEDRELLEAL